MRYHPVRMTMMWQPPQKRFDDALSVQRMCYAQALGVVDIGSLLVELSERVRVRSGRPSCCASQGQNHGVRRGYKGSEEVRQSA